MPYDVRVIANLVLKVGAKEQRRLTNMDVNKIVYFLHASYLIEHGEPLVQAKIEAWEYGPVFREIYSALKVFGKDPINNLIRRRNRFTLESEIAWDRISEEDQRYLVNLARNYVKFDTFTLVDMSHAPGGPWDRVFHHLGKTHVGMEITNELIYEHHANATRH